MYFITKYIDRILNACVSCLTHEPG